MNMEPHQVMICDAIAERLQLHFSYGGHQRTVIPAAYGPHKDTGKPALRGYQVDGTSSSRQPPFWSLFTEAEMSELATGEKFDQNPPLYDPNDTHLHVVCCLAAD